jgi:hypothetical protein
MGRCHDAAQHSLTRLIKIVFIAHDGIFFMINFKRNASLLFLLISFGSIHAFIFDNRWFPLYPWNYSRTKDKPSVFMGAPFLMVANEAAIDDDECDGIPEVWGKYDLNKLANGIVALGRQHPFLGTSFEQYIGRDIPFKLDGKIEGQGLGFVIEQALTDNISIGGSWYAMHVFSRIHFVLGTNSLGLTAEQITELDALRRSIQASIGLESPKSSRSGFSDIDLYIRLGNIWDYTHKFRRIDAGLRAGVLIPSGVTREINNPASLPFGGNGHWGAYIAADLEFELKEDMKIGSLFYLCNRFAKTARERMPLADEHPLFGALVGNARIDQGLTFVFSPYFRLEDIREGLGVSAKYTLVHHFDDFYKDARETKLQVPEVRLATLNDLSDWSAEYLTLNVFYDFARVRMDSYYAPELFLAWDIPVQLALVERACKTHRVSFGIKFRY